MLLERTRPRLNWFAALEVTLTRPDGVPERRAGEDPWNPKPIARPRRVSDDLAWLRQAMDDPEGHGLTAMEDGLPVWEARDDPETVAKLNRLQQRGVLEAAGFLLHAPSTA